MAKDESFDVVSEYDHQELVNAIDQVQRELSTRFDLKDSGSEVELKGQPAEITITSTDETRLRNIHQILGEKLAKRGLSPFLLKPDKTENALGGRVRQQFKIQTGIDKELAKKVVSEIKDLKLKVQASIQGDQVRVSGKSRDDLQAVITCLRDRSAHWEVPLQFTNYR